MASELPPVQRIITGHDANGKSTVQKVDALEPLVRTLSDRVTLKTSVSAA